MKKKVLSCILTAVMCFSALPGGLASAANDKVYGWTTAVSGTGACAVGGDACYGSAGLTLQAGKSGDGATAATNISVQAGKQYKVTFWTKGKNLSTANAVVGSTKLSLTKKYTSYYWTRTDYEFTAQSDSANFKIGFELSNGGTLSVDGIYVRSADERRNLVTNGGFEYAETKNEFLSGMTLPAEEELASFGTKNVMPMLYMDSFELDGNLDEWDGFASAAMPNSATDMTGMKNYGGDSDLFAEFELAYDEKNIYLAAAVVDDIFDNPNTGASYWKGDSIQVALGTVEEDFGVEIGLYQNNDGESGIYSSELIKDAWGTIDDTTMYLRENSKVVVKRVGNVTYYEAQLPWLFRFDSVPDECLINVLVNDSDGNGRKGFFELQPGIGFTKSNEKFIFGTPMKNTGDIFAYIDGAKWLYEDEPGDYSLYVANTSEADEKIEITLPDGNTFEANVPQGRVYKYDYTTVSDEVGMLSDKITLKYGDTELSAVKNIRIKRDLVKAFSQLETELLPELKELEAKCVERGITPAYEQSDISTIENFIAYGREDLGASRDSRADYVYTELVKLYENVKEALTAYLDGSRTPTATYVYTGSKAELEDMHYVAEMKNTETGEVEKRPVYFVGYNIGEGASKLEKTYADIEAIGANLVQIDQPMNYYMSKAAGTIRGWTTYFNGGIDATAEYDSREVQSGDYSLKIKNNTAQKAYVNFALSKNISLEKGKTYVLSFWAKADSASGCIFRPNGWNPGSISLNGIYDWKKFTYEYNPEQNETKELLWIVENVTASLNLDNIRLVEKGTNKNLINHGGFEEQPVVVNGFAFDEDRLESQLIAALDNAQKHNVQMDVLLGMHYFPKIVDNWALTKSAGYYGMNINNPEVLQVMEAFITGVMERIKDHPALHSVCLSNEPNYSTGRNADLFGDDWTAYLKKIYNDDLAALNDVYGTEYASFEEVPLTEENINDVMYYDYIRFNAEVWGGWHEWAASVVKKVAPNVKVHAKIQEVAENTEGSDAVLGTPLVSRGIDPEMFSSFVDISGCDAVNFIQRNDELVKKEMWYDLISSFNGKPVFNSEDHVIVDGDENYTSEYAPFVSADMWQGAVHNRSDTTIWIWTRTTALNNHIAGNINHRPDVLAANSKMNLDLNRLSKEIAALQAKPENVGVLYSLQSRVYELPHMNTVSEIYRAVTFAGERVKFFTENMIETQGIDENIKLLVIGNAQCTNAETVKGIRSFIERGGRVMVIGDVFKYDEHKKPLSNPEDVEFVLNSALIVPSRNEEREVKFDFDFYTYMADYLKEIGIRSIEIIDPETGAPLANTEYTSGICDGKLIINICNTDVNTVKKFKILVDGKEPENLVELRSGAKLEGVTELPSHTPMLVRVDG